MLPHGDGAKLTLQCTRSSIRNLPLVQNKKLVLLACKWLHVYLIAKIILIITTLIYFLFILQNTQKAKEDTKIIESVFIYYLLVKTPCGYFLLF